MVDLIPRYLVHEFMLTIHAYLRWGVLVAGLLSWAASLHGWGSGRRWTFADERMASAMVMWVDLQLVVGLLLYLWLSPMSEAVFRAGLRATVTSPPLLFFGVLHPCLMILGFLLVHVVRVRGKKASTDRERFRVMSLGLSLWGLLVTLAIPWPWMPWGRSLFRGI